MKFFSFAILGLAIFSITTNVYAKYNRHTVRQYVGIAYKFQYTSYKLKTPRKLIRYNTYNFIYLSDKEQFGVEEYWQDPLEFFINKKGDCEDYAIWNYYILSLHGYNPQFLKLKNKKSGRFHAIVKIIYKNKVVYIGIEDYCRKIPQQYEVVRIMNQPYNNKIKPINNEKRDMNILKQGEMIKIK